MSVIFSKRAAAATIILIVIVVGIFLFVTLRNKAKPIIVPPVEVKVQSPTVSVLGLSGQNREINSYTYGTGDKKIVFIGGIHGGYEWNSVLLAYKFMDYLQANPNIIPKNLSVIVIPSMNPDGVFKVVGKEDRFTVADVPNNIELTKPGRFNARKVDLNRNFDCRWQATGTWQGKTVSAGTAAFSEPESKVFQNFVLKNNLSTVVFWHSQSNGVYASQCNKGISSSTMDIVNTYSKASGYPAQISFDSYTVTGAADDWLASINIPAMSVELKTHENIEWDKNLAGAKALFEYFGNK